MCNCGMKSEHLVGTNIPRFTYDTPTVPENDFYALCEGSRPLCMIFLPGFDHPVSREYITRYLKTLPALKGARLACVVRSRSWLPPELTMSSSWSYLYVGFEALARMAPVLGSSTTMAPV